MKKIFVILTSLVLLLACSLPLFSVHAAESDTTDIIFNQTFSMDSVRSSWDMDAQGRYCINGDFIYKGESYNKMYFHATTNMFNVSSPSGGGYVPGSYNAEDDTFTFTGEFVITVTGDQFGSDGVQNWLSENTTFKLNVCDGTECAWADDDYDGICDTCGVRLMSFRYDLLAYAHEFLNGSFTDHGYWVISEDTVFPSGDTYYTIYKSRTPFKYGSGGIYSDSDYLRGMVQLGSDGVPTSVWWVTIDSETVTLVNNPIEVSHDIEGFFPLPLHQMVGVVVNQEMLAMVQKTLRVMMVLMISGVACLAFLIVLSLFGKRSLIFPKQ